MLLSVVSLFAAAASAVGTAANEVKRHHSCSHSRPLGIFRVIHNTDTGLTITIKGIGYTGPSENITINNSTSDDPEILARIPAWESWDTAGGTNITTNVTIPEKPIFGVCGGAKRCAQVAWDRSKTGALAIFNTGGKVCTTAAGSIMKYFKDNEYEKVKDLIVLGLFTGFVVNLVSTPVGDVEMNAVSESETPGDKEPCQFDTYEDVADGIVSAMYNFCMTVSKAKDTSARIETHYYQGQMNEDRDKMIGDYIVTKMFLAVHEEDWAPKCNAMGVQF